MNPYLVLDQATRLLYEQVCSIDMHHSYHWITLLNREGLRMMSSCILINMAATAKSGETWRVDDCVQEWKAKTEDPSHHFCRMFV